MTELSLRLDAAGYQPGALMRISVTWKLPRVPEQLRLLLGWETAGRGTQDHEVVIEELIPVSEASGETTIEVPAPLAPYSVSGGLISIAWYAEVHATPGSQMDRAGFVCAPGGREVLLPAEEAPGWRNGRRQTSKRKR